MQPQYSHNKHLRYFYFTFFILAAYCFMATFSTEDSKPKNDLISIVADCSKHVQSGLSG